MRVWTRRTRRCAGILALAAGVVLAAVSPASAAAPNRADGLQLTGIIPADPFVVSTFPGTSSNHAGSINLPSLFSTGIVDTAASSTAAGATVNNLTLVLTSFAALNVGTLFSSCAYNPGTGTVSGTSQLTAGIIVGLGIPLPIATNPLPNTIIAIPGVATLTLNKQVTAGDGTLTVNALSISLFGGLETITVGNSVCNAATLT